MLDELTYEKYELTQQGIDYYNDVNRRYISGEIKSRDEWFNEMMKAFSGDKSQEGVYWVNLRTASPPGNSKPGTPSLPNNSRLNPGRFF